jgi:hypothetical protein
MYKCLWAWFYGPLVDRRLVLTTSYLSRVGFLEDELGVDKLNV